MSILAINAGSSSLKFALYPIADNVASAASLTGMIEGLQPGGSMRLLARNQERVWQPALTPTDDPDPFEAALKGLQNLLQQALGDATLQAVAHRVVHGGTYFQAPVLVDGQVLEKIALLCPLAPLHQPHNIKGIHTMMAAWPQIPHVACFDTAFHATMPITQKRFALPESFARQGICRYGFHGLSYHYLRDTLRQRSARANDKVVMAHLGNGASVCAMQNGQSAATSMGFSALDGLMMGTRSGAIDAGVLLHLLKQGWDHARLQDLLYKQSGLLGVSGVSADMRTLRQTDTPAAQLAIEMFTRRTTEQCAAMAASLGGIDILTFTGGIGEHDATLRAQVCAQLAFMGITIDPQANQLADGTQIMPVHAPSSRVEIWVVPTDEGRVAAQQAASLINRAPAN